jgi:hypothetical protein
VLLVAVPVVSLAMHFANVLGRDLHPGRDHSVYELNTIGFLHGRQLVGPYSQFGWHHLGPAFFALLAVPYALSGFHSLSLVFAMLAWAAAMMVAFVAIARRHAGACGAVVAVGALWAFLEYENRLPLYNYWSPFFTYLAFPSCAALIACVAGNGGDRVLPWALALSSVLVQTHLGVAVPICAMWAVTASVRVLARRHAVIGTLPLTRRAVWISGATIAALWTLPVAAELRGFGNWSRIWTFFGTARGHPSWSFVFDRAAAEITAPLRRILFEHNGYSYIRHAPPWTSVWTILSVAYVAGLVASVIVAWRSRRPELAALSACALVAAVLSPLTMRRIVGPIEPHYVAWVAGATVVGLTGIAGTAGSIVARRWHEESPLRHRVRLGAPWLAFTAFSIWLTCLRGFVPTVHLITPELTRLADRIDSRLRSGGHHAVVVHGTPVTMPWHFNLGLELYRRGHSVRFAVSQADFHVGAFWTRPIDARATVHLVTPKASARGEPLGCEDPPLGSLIVGSVCAWLEDHGRR